MTIIPYSINKKDLWNLFVARSKNGSFLLQRNYIDYYAETYFDCSVLVFEGGEISDVAENNNFDPNRLLAVFPANWVEEEKSVYSHQGLPYGGLVLKDEVTAKEVAEILQSILMYYKSYLLAEKLIYKPIPYIYSTYPVAEDLYALFRANSKLTDRQLSSVVSVKNPIKMQTLRVRQAKKAIDYGYYIDRLTEEDTDSLDEYWELLTESKQKNGTAPEHSKEDMLQLMKIFPRQIRLYLVRSGRSIVSGAVIFECKKVAYINYLASTDEGRQLGALDLLFRHLVNERYKQMDYIDMGPSNRGNGWSINEELLTQKEEFGGRAVCYDTYEIRLQNLPESLLPHMEKPEKRLIKYLDLKQINAQYNPEMTEAVVKVVQRGWYLLGEETKRYEAAYAGYTGAGYCVCVANGLDAITLILKAYKKLRGWSDGDEVIVPANTYIATILAVTQAGLKPVLCAPSLTTYLMDPTHIPSLVTQRTRVVLPVHLYGRCCDMDAIQDVADEYGLLVVDDAAQAHGARYKGRVVGNLCDATATSFYPGKNLGALGDAGAVTTHDKVLADMVRTMANYGSVQKYVNECKGVNSRIDEVQAAALGVKLPYLDRENEKRRKIALLYEKGIINPLITKPTLPKDLNEHVFHVYAIRCPERKKLQEYLLEHGIETMIHYPIPPHKQLAYEEWKELHMPVTERIHNEELSLPISPLLEERDVQHIISTINAFTVEL